MLSLLKNNLIYNVLYELFCKILNKKNAIENKIKEHTTCAANWSGRREKGC